MEHLAASYVTLHGYRIMLRNFESTHGEVDIIAGQRDLVAFIEVRYRAQGSFGSGLDSVDVHKQKRIIATAQRFIQRYPSCEHHRCRFDVLSISRPNLFPHLQWTRNAFTHDDTSPAFAANDPNGAFGLRIFQ